MPTSLRSPAVEAAPHNLWSSRFCRSVISPSRRLTVMTRTPPLLTLSRVTAAPVLVWDRGKMHTKCGKSAEICRAEQAAKAARRQQLYAVASLLSLSESVSSKLVAPMQTPWGQSPTGPPNRPWRRGCRHRTQRPRNTLTSSGAVGIRGCKLVPLTPRCPSISHGDPGVPSPRTRQAVLYQRVMKVSTFPLGLYRHPSRGSPWPHGCPRRPLPLRPSPPTCL